MKIKFPFWSRQPVYHFHKLHYFFNNDKYIFKKHDEMDSLKFYDPMNIKIIPYKNISHYENNKFLIDSYFQLVRNHYLREKKSIFIPSNQYLINSLINNENGTSYFALYTKSKTLIHNKDVLSMQNVISGLTSKEIILYRKDSMKKLYIHYVDFLCTHKEFRKQNITPKVIYTYAKEVMKNTKNSNSNSIFMFKREANSQSFVPYTVYSNFVFDLKYYVSKYKKIKTSNDKIIPMNDFKVEYINESNSEILIRSLETIKNNISHFLHIPYSTINTYIKHGILHFFVVHKNGIPCAIYVFKNNCFFFNEKKVFECMSSIYFPSTNFGEDCFKYFFNESIEMLINTQNIGYITLENLSMNDVLIKNFRKIQPEMHKYTNNFYLYNYILNSTLSKNIFMIL